MAVERYQIVIYSSGEAHIEKYSADPIYKRRPDAHIEHGQVREIIEMLNKTYPAHVSLYIGRSVEPLWSAYWATQFRPD